METSPETDHGQTALWNRAAGRGWVDLQDVVDQALGPLQDVLVQAVVDAVDDGEGGSDGPARRVLDVGCGTGGMTVAMARRLGAGADCTGIDISEPMIAAAVDRAEREGVRAQFVRADAQRHPFEPASVDVVASRFGVMFFDDPVQAFANLRAATRDGGVLRCVTWRGADENPFMTTAERAAAPLIPIPPREPDGPGQFGFAHAGRVRSILERSGWSGIDHRSIDVTCTFPEKYLVTYFTRLGPLGLVLADRDEAVPPGIVEAVRPAFDPFVEGSDIRFTAACWLVSAHA